MKAPCRNKSRLIVPLLAALAFSLWGNSSSAEVDIQKLLSKGINFDHIFEPYQGEGDPSLAFGEDQRKEMETNLKEAEFEQVAQLGFTHVRLNLGRAFIQQNKEPFDVRPEGLALLDKAVDMALKNHLGIILDIHQIPPPNLFHDPKALDNFRKLWKALAAHYAHRSEAIVFELLNEPNVDIFSNGERPPKEEDWEHWREIMKDLVGAIRKEDTDRTVIVTGGGWGGAGDLIQMGNLHLPRLVYTFHCYEPMVFTHQGATWEAKVFHGIREVPYPLPESVVKKLWADAKREHQEEWPFSTYPHGFKKSTMRDYLKPVMDFSKKEGLVLYCGEFGVHKPAPPESRARWISDYVSLMKENGVGWAMWAYHAGFDLVDKEGVADPAIVKALGLKN